MCPRNYTRDARYTYRCCLRGPDGIRKLAPVWFLGHSRKLTEIEEAVNRERREN
jgi:hypothetical protein